MLGTLSSVFGLSCASGSRFLGSCQTGKFGRYQQRFGLLWDWETGKKCKVYPTFAGKQIKNINKWDTLIQFTAPSRSWEGSHQYQLNIKQEDLKVYARDKTNNSIKNSSPATLVSLLSTRFACSKYRMTTKDHQWQWIIIDYQKWSTAYHWLATYRLLPSHTIN